MNDNQIGASGKGCFIAFFMLIPHLSVTAIAYVNNLIKRDSNIILKCAELVFFLIISTIFSPVILCIDWFILAATYSKLSFEEATYKLFVEWKEWK